MPKVVLNKMLGINASKAKLQLQPGESDGLQNIRCRPFDNWVKRKGIEAISSQSDPINGIFEIELDNITIPLIQSGDTLTFFPDLSSANGSMGDPSSDSAVFGSSDPLDPTGRRIALFLVEQTMRAIQDRRVTAGHSTFSWPNLIFAADGTQLNGNTGIAVSAYPANNLYGPDITYHDIFYGNPAGTRAAELVNSIIQCCLTTVGFNDYLDTDVPIEGASSVTLLDASSFPSFGSATRSNYRQKLNNCKTGIRKMFAISRSPSQVNVEEKEGQASDPVSTCPAGPFSISGYSDSFFSATIVGCTSCARAFAAWDGSFTFSAETATHCDYDGVLHINRTISSGKWIVTANISGVIATNVWTLEIDIADNTCSNSTQIWIGNKTGGTFTPAGVYAILSSDCTATPATITIV
jgi:hypothetical protein